MNAPAPVVADLELVDAVVRDLAAVEDWSVFWHPVNDSLLGYDYGERVRAATGWQPVLPDFEMSNGTVSIDFKLPGGGAAGAWSTSVRVTHPAPLWAIVIPPGAATEDVRAEARRQATEAMNGFSERFAAVLGAPAIGPIGAGPDAVPAPLRINASGLIAAWQRTSSMIQLAVSEHGGRYPDQPVDFSFYLTVRPQSSRHE
jgi:hypothetical protein